MKTLTLKLAASATHPHKGSSAVESRPCHLGSCRGDLATNYEYEASCDRISSSGMAASFKPHAIILTERTRPEPIFVAALIGAEQLLRVDFDLDGEGESYVKKSLEGVERRLAKWNGTIPAFGRPTGLIVNYAPNFAVRFDLRGTPREIFGEAYRIGQACLLLKGRRIPPGALPRVVHVQHLKRL